MSLSTVIDKSSYRAGETISVTLELNNNGNSPICLSETPLGTISFVTLTRDGSPVPTRQAPSSFITSLTEMVKSKLVAVASNSSIKILLTSSYDPGLDSEILYTTAMDGTSGITTFYDIGKPGDYALEMAYHYQAGATEKCIPVYEKIMTTETIYFTVTP